MHFDRVFDRSNRITWLTSSPHLPLLYCDPCPNFESVEAMDEKTPDQPIGNASDAISDTTPNGGIEVERKRNYDKVVENPVITREYSLSLFSYNAVNVNVKSR